MQKVYRPKKKLGTLSCSVKNRTECPKLLKQNIISNMIKTGQKCNNCLPSSKLTCIINCALGTKGRWFHVCSCVCHDLWSNIFNSSSTFFSTNSPVSMSGKSLIASFFFFVLLDFIICFVFLFSPSFIFSYILSVASASKTSSSKLRLKETSSSTSVTVFPCMRTGWSWSLRVSCSEILKKLKKNVKNS